MNALESLTTLRFSRRFAAEPIESFLSHFADVRAGEGVGVLLMALNLFLLLDAYYLLKTVREVLILTQGGAEVKSYLRLARPLFCSSWCRSLEPLRRE